VPLLPGIAASSIAGMNETDSEAMIPRKTRKEM